MATRPGLRTVLLVILLAAYFSPITYASTKDRSDPQLVRLSYVQGDVRFNRGNGKQTDIKQPWEQAVTNLAIEQNYALATGNGRAEIEFESGSVMYVAENTVVLFQELKSTNDVPTTTLEVVSGTVTIGLQPIPNEYFEIDTPTGLIQSRYPQKSFVRIDAYLDGMRITPQVDTTADFSDDPMGAPLAKGQTVTIPDGGEAWAAKPGELRASDVFDNWVRARYESRSATMEAALKASGFSSPVLGLTDMYESGTFTPCAPYGMCWDPKPQAQEANASSTPTATRSAGTAPTESQTKLTGAAALQSSGLASAQTAPGSAAQGAVKPFEPVDVSTFQFGSLDHCPYPANSRAATGVGQEHTEEARTREELRELQMRRSEAQGLSFFPVCHYARWVHQRMGYRAVVRRRRVDHPVHWVKVGKQTGFVPASPLDKKGQPPANLRHGIYVPSKKHGAEQIERVDFNPREKVEILAGAPKEFRAVSQSSTAKAERPEIQGRLLPEASGNSKFTNSERNSAMITYDYRKQTFVSRGVAMPGRTSRPVVVGNLNSHGDFSGHGAAPHDGGRNSGGSFGHESGGSERQSSENRSNGSGGGGSRGGVGTGESRSGGSSADSSPPSNSSASSRPK